MGAIEVIYEFQYIYILLIFRFSSLVTSFIILSSFVNRMLL